MPSSPNRRRVEIPLALHDRLERRAQRDGLTTSALATALLTGALDREGSPEPQQAEQLQEIGDAVRRLLASDKEQVQELRAVRRQVSELAQAIRGEDAASRATPFRTMPLPEGEVGEYLRLLLIRDMAESPDLRELYARQAEELRRRMQSLAMSEPVRGQEQSPRAPMPGDETRRDLTPDEVAQLAAHLRRPVE